MNRLMGYFLFFLLVAGQTASAQLQNSNWYFNDNFGLEFVADPSVPPNIVASAMEYGATTGSVSDEMGNLLFYTNGHFAWDRLHNLMPTAINPDLGADAIAAETVIVPRPGSDRYYYIFVIERDNVAPYSLPNSNTLTYSVVDMQANGGMGDLVAVNVSLEHPDGTPVTSIESEKLTSTLSADGESVFVIAQIGGLIYTYRLDSDGMDSPESKRPVATSPAAFSTHSGWFREFGEMRVSPDNTKLAIAYHGFGSGSAAGKVTLYDFDANSGVADFHSNVILPYEQFDPYGLEFSENSRYLYVSHGHGYLAHTVSSGSGVGIFRCDLNDLGAGGLGGGACTLERIVQNPSAPLAFLFKMRRAINGDIYGNGYRYSGPAADNYEGEIVLQDPNAEFPFPVIQPNLDKTPHVESAFPSWVHKARVSTEESLWPRTFSNTIIKRPGHHGLTVDESGSVYFYTTNYSDYISYEADTAVDWSYFRPYALSIKLDSLGRYQHAIAPEGSYMTGNGKMTSWNDYVYKIAREGRSLIAYQPDGVVLWESGFDSRYLQLLQVEANRETGFVYLVGLDLARNQIWISKHKGNSGDQVALWVDDYYGSLEELYRKNRLNELENLIAVDEAHDRLFLSIRFEDHYRLHKFDTSGAVLELVEVNDSVEATTWPGMDDRLISKKISYCAELDRVFLVDGYRSSDRLSSESSSPPGWMPGIESRIQAYKGAEINSQTLDQNHADFEFIYNSVSDGGYLYLVGESAVFKYQPSTNQVIWKMGFERASTFNIAKVGNEIFVSGKYYGEQVIADVGGNTAELPLYTTAQCLGNSCIGSDFVIKLIDQGSQYELVVE